jgi:arsenate reductase
MAESILRSVGAARFNAFSAGCMRRAPVNASVVDFLAQHHLPVSGLWSKTLEHFGTPESPRMDFIITLCDAAASERFLEWAGPPFIAHWNVDTEGAAADGDDALRDSFWTLMRRIKIFTSLPHGKLSRRLLEQRARTLEPSYL